MKLAFLRQSTGKSLTKRKPNATMTGNENTPSRHMIKQAKKCTRAALLLLLLGAAAVAPAQEQPDIEEAQDMNPEPPRREERRHGEVPAMFRDDACLDDSHANQELGINVYTAPSIKKIFDQLDAMPPIPEEYVLRARPEKLSTHAGALALDMGFLLADGFIAVRSGHMNDVKPIALDLTRYGKVLGVGEKMNVHSASLLENAEKGKLEEFKRTLSATQVDVNEELAALRDPDLSHLIALGGWIRALNAACAALEKRFSEEAAAVIFYPDAPEYFSEILACLNPKTAKKLHVEEMNKLLRQLADEMTLPEGAKPTPEAVKRMHETVARLSTLAVGEGYEH